MNTGSFGFRPSRLAPRCSARSRAAGIRSTKPTANFQPKEERVQADRDEDPGELDQHEREFREGNRARDDRAYQAAE